jgi:hypothetical protein
MQILSLLSPVKLISTFDRDKIYAIKSNALLGLSVAAVIISLVSFELLSKAIKAVAAPSSDAAAPFDLTILDVRHGYTVNEVNDLMIAWGLHGRMIYVIIEAIDVFLYMTAYRATFIIVMNHLSGLFSATYSFPKARYFAMLPICLSMIDIAEDIGQVFLTVFFTRAHMNTVWWRIAVNITSTINLIKWTVVRLGSAATLIIIVACGVGRLLSRPKE